MRFPMYFKVLVALSAISMSPLSLACEKHAHAKNAKLTATEKAPVQEAAADALKDSSGKEAHPVSVSSNSDVQVIEFVLANKIESREPKEIVEAFNQENGIGYAFARLSPQKNTQVTFVWLKNDREQSRFTTNVHASKQWRTFASTKLRPGEWKVQLLEGDVVLAEQAFTVK